MIFVSACLLGEPCKYNGGHNRNAKVLAFLEGKEYLPICPEALGGLPIPRSPVEKQGERYISRDGKDHSAAFQKGAQAVLNLALLHRPTLIILKERSPSCGSKQIYDGSFSGKRIEGMGCTAALLRRHGFPVISEEEI